MEDLELRVREWLEAIKGHPYSFTSDQINYIEREFKSFVKSIVSDESNIKKLLPIFKEYFN